MFLNWPKTGFFPPTRELFDLVVAGAKMNGHPGFSSLKATTTGWSSERIGLSVGRLMELSTAASSGCCLGSPRQNRFPALRVIFLLACKPKLCQRT